MIDLVYQIILPFVLSALIVILITIVAEKYGTKIGGIIGTLPTTIIIAYIFIALNKGIIFASNSVAVVPAEMGVNIVFVCLFAVLSYRSTINAFFSSFFVWLILSTILYLVNLQNIYLSIIVFTTSMISMFIILEKKFKIKSQGKRTIHYSPQKILLRGILTGIIIAISVLLSNINEVLSGIFTVFPAIFSSTMLITLKEHGPNFSAGIAKSMIFGSPSVMSYAVSIHFLYPTYGISFGSIFSFIISVVITLIIFKLRKKIS